MASDAVECVVIEKPDQAIEIYERESLSRLYRHQTDSIKHLIEQKFKTVPKLENLYS